MEPIYKQFEAFYDEQLCNVCLPARIIAGYHVKACLLSGSQKEIYHLLSLDSRQPYVLKQLPIDLKQANEAEYALLKCLDHPGIPTAVELFEEDGFSYFIRSYAQGEPLHQLVKAYGAFNGREIADIALQLCDVLIYLHTQKPSVIHRDIKPQNVIRAPDGTVYLIDFDISRRFDPEASQDTVFIGTSATAPPEQFGYAQTDVRSDIYALGILMIYLSTGRYDRTCVRDMPASLAKIAEKCTQFAPRDRYVSAAKLKRALLLYKRSFGVKLIKITVLAASLAAAFLLGRLFPFEASALASTNAPIPSAAVTDLTVHAETGLNGAVSFVSPLIEKNIRAQLEKTAGEPIMADELVQITELSIAGVSTAMDVSAVRFDNEGAVVSGTPLQRGDIESLADLSILKNLRKLELVYQHINDISPLASLHLTILNIEGNFVSDLTPLGGMTGLKELTVGRNPISDLSPLSSLPRLRRLSAEQIEASDITPLAKIQSLEIADLFDIPCADYSPLVELPSLKSVNISDSSVSDVAVVVGNKRLTQIIAHRCGITSLAIFKTLPDLEWLELWQNDIRDLSGVEAFQSLKHLNLNYTPVEDLTPLTKLKHLEELELRRVVADLAPLLEIPSLKKVQCTSDAQEAIDRIAGKAKFAIEVIDE